MLLKLPYIPQSKILQQLQLHEQFFVGLCSKRARNLIKYFSRFKYDSSVIHVPSFCLQLQTTGDQGKHVAMWASCYYRPENERFYKANNNNWNRTMRFWYKEKKIKCKLSFDPEIGIPIFWCKDQYKSILPMALHSAICDVFSISPIIQVLLNLPKLSEMPYTKEVDNLILGGGITDIDVYESLMQMFTIKNCAYISPDTNYLSVNSKTLSVNHLYCSYTRWFTGEHLINFQGRTAVFRRVPSKISSEDLINFLFDWQQGTNKKLEAIIISLNKDNRMKFSRTEVFEKLNAKSWNQERRAGRFKYPDATYKTTFPSDILDCSQEMDIERKSDGLLATVVVHETLFCFFVWHNRFPDTSTHQPITRCNPYTRTEEFAVGNVHF
ncbi:hypothetical protein CRE_28923 [Caenorhabditis remanei]|uniref:F-box domain-containing protein n=1 Tax=Caenorhabditis remanei TaxID=31234 RepID=E3MXI3_CAERE|nr:hypothetical protein CRE_28923 [Caenorhabditis remanei]